MSLYIAVAMSMKGCHLDNSRKNICEFFSKCLRWLEAIYHIVVMTRTWRRKE
jgi:hypothetical protein